LPTTLESQSLGLGFSTWLLVLPPSFPVHILPLVATATATFVLELARPYLQLRLYPILRSSLSITGTHGTAVDPKCQDFVKVDKDGHPQDNGPTN